MELLLKEAVDKLVWVAANCRNFDEEEISELWDFIHDLLRRRDETTN